MRRHGTAWTLFVAAAIAVLAPVDVDAALRRDDGKASTTVAHQLRGKNRFSTRGGNEAASDEDVLALEDLAYWDRYLIENNNSLGPAPTPSPGPTVCNGLTERQRQRRILDEITASGVSSRKDIADDRSPQGRALDWITIEDEAQLCPNDDNLIQRYIMAVFYYSTDGDRWAECSAGSASVRAKEVGEKEPITVILEENATPGDDDDDEQLVRMGGGNKDKGGESNCLKYCRDRCCSENGGDRLCNESKELECRAGCFEEAECDFEEARKELEEARRKRDNDSDSRDRDNKKKNDDKRKKKDSKKGGRDDTTGSQSKGRRLQNAPCGAPNSGFPGKKPYLSGSSECDWAGSKCDGKDISVIGFEGNDLGGTFPAEILALNKLRNLTLEGGRTSGTIPEEWGSGVWNGESLQVLDLDQNRLSGPISNNLFNLNTLKVLDIDENRLEGTLSDRVGRLSNLVFVEFEDNRFKGKIPDTFSKLTKLRTATFRGNNFSGSMPASVCGNRVPDGLLNILTADCAGNNPKIKCDCCSSCF